MTTNEYLKALSELESAIHVARKFPPAEFFPNYDGCRLHDFRVGRFLIKEIKPHNSVGALPKASNEPKS